MRDRSTTLAAILLLSLFVCSVPALAHHSIASEYDIHQAVTISGKVTRVEWMNPHIYVYLDSKNDSGKSVHVVVQAGAPNSLTRLGWKRDSLKAGDFITVAGFRAREGWNLINARDVTMADGHKVQVMVIDPQHN